MNARGIIRQAMTDHRDAMRAECIQQAEQADDMAQLTHNATARKAAIARHASCLATYDAISNGDLGGIMLDCSRFTIALHIACELLDVPRLERAALAADWERLQ